VIDPNNLTQAETVGKFNKPHGSYVEPATSDGEWSQQMAIGQSHSYALRNSPASSAQLFIGDKPVEALGDHCIDGIMPFDTNFTTARVQP
jgi:hypothetical protein